MQVDVMEQLISTTVCPEYPFPKYFLLRNMLIVQFASTDFSPFSLFACSLPFSIQNEISGIYGHCSSVNIPTKI